MWNFKFLKLEKIVTWKIAGILVILFILCSLGFAYREHKIGQEMFDGCWFNFPLKDCWYPPQHASKVLDEIGENGRNIYAITQVTLDFVFPFVYGGLVIILLFALYGRVKYILLIPVLAVVLDFLENITTAYLAWRYEKGVESPLTWFASSFTAGKSIGIYLSLIFILIGVLLFIRRRYK